MVLNVLSQQQTRYILKRADLEAFLQSKYGTSHNFNIQVCTPNVRVDVRELTVPSAQLRPMVVRCARDCE
jgi:hypothetical protein